ncbi:MAG: chemotaxis-specific protein-glutamate methyltransferase CheB, partial [Tepidanaerobacteraceae bacterium]|nr:chemotaxis-specific protein-glutamate methyltransferase CheB [Tepidanaerobacteraceae bacterium]
EEMPDKNGLEVLNEIKKISTSEVIMVSSLTTKGSLTTVEALSIGAFDFVQKPSGNSIIQMNKTKKELIEKIRHAWELKKRKKRGKIFKADVEKNTKQHKPERKIEAVALGASTGGPKVLYDIITKIPKDIGVPVFVVQHMPSGFTKAFAERLDNNSSLRVIEAVNEQLIKPGTVYIAPGGYHMTVSSQKIILDKSAPIHGVRPSVDKLFTSVAEAYNEKSLCCIFTGMGKDGAEGVKAIKAKGGFTIAQDEVTSVVYGMPKAAYETGCIDIVIPDYEISKEIVKIVRLSNDR